MPTGYTPIYRVYKDGYDVTDRFNDRTTAITVELVAGGGDGDVCQITVDDRDWLVERPLVGDNLEVHLGYEEVGLSYMGQFTIDNIVFNGPPKSITLHGNSTGMGTAIRSPIIRSYVQHTVSDILQEIAQAGGYQVQVHADLARKLFAFKNQSVSPLHMLQEMERTFGAVAKVADGRLIFVPRDAGETASGMAMPMLILGPSHFATWQVRHTNRTDYSGVRASYWDADAAERRWVQHDRPVVANEDGESLFRMGHLFGSREHAEAAAHARMMALTRAMGEGVFVLAKGDPWIRDQQHIIVQGMRDGIDGEYVVFKAQHSYSKDTGLVSQLECQPPGDGETDESDFVPRIEAPEGGVMGEALLMPWNQVVGGE